jgi:hypothetical protein
MQIRSASYAQIEIMSVKWGLSQRETKFELALKLQLQVEKNLGEQS